MNVIITGAGVIGLCTAYYLRKQGHDVTVIDRNNITDGCSFGNMGYVSPSHFIPLATPGIIKQGIKWMMSSSSPFYIKPRLNLDLIRWGLLFKKSATLAEVEKNTPHLNNLLQLSRALMIDLKMQLPEFDMPQKGCWMLYKSATTREHEKHLADQAHKFGLKTVDCTRQQVQEYEKEVEVDVAGGILYLDDCYVSPRGFMQSLHTQLQNMGVKFLLNSEVVKFEKKGAAVAAVITRQNRYLCDELILANGSWMGEISKLLGLKIPMQPGKGYSLDYHLLEKNLSYPSILVDDRTATTPLNRSLRIGGTMELSGHSTEILPRRVMAIYHAFKKYYPGVAIPEPRAMDAWFGYRPVTPDGMPYIGRHQAYNNVCFAGGHAMLGVSAAAATGLLISEIVDRQPTSIDMSAFDPARFD